MRLRFLTLRVHVLLAIAFIGGVLPNIVIAQTGNQASTPGELTIQTEIILPGEETYFERGVLRGRVDDVADYIGIVYNFLISIVGVVAGVIILVGGFQYLTAGGDAARVGAAKRRIGNAVLGLVLALSSYVLLNALNPDLVRLKVPTGLDKKVKTELATAPWCELLLKKGTKVEVVTSKRRNINKVGCGDIGEYSVPGNESKLYCLFYGPGYNEWLTSETGHPFTPTSWATTQVCLQGARSTQDELSKEAAAARLRVEEAVKKGASEDYRLESYVTFAKLMTCNTLAKGTDALEDLGFGTEATSGVCERWSQTREQLKKELNPSSSIYTFCNFRHDGLGCAEATIDCKNYNSCDDYDNGPELIVFRKRTDSGLRMEKFDDLDDLPKQLDAMCTLNPCQVNQPKGCEGPGITAYLPGVRLATSDCDPADD